MKVKSAKKEVRKLIRMSKEEDRILRQLAKDTGLSVSAYIRMLIHQEEKK